MRPRIVLGSSLKRLRWEVGSGLLSEEREWPSRVGGIPEDHRRVSRPAIVHSEETKLPETVERDLQLCALYEATQTRGHAS